MENIFWCEVHRNGERSVGYWKVNTGKYAQKKNNNQFADAVDNLLSEILPFFNQSYFQYRHIQRELSSSTVAAAEGTQPDNFCVCLLIFYIWGV